MDTPPSGPHYCTISDSAYLLPFGLAFLQSTKIPMPAIHACSMSHNDIFKRIASTPPIHPFRQAWYIMRQRLHFPKTNGVGGIWALPFFSVPWTDAKKSRRHLSACRTFSNLRFRLFLVGGASSQGGCSSRFTAKFGRTLSCTLQKAQLVG